MSRAPETITEIAARYGRAPATIRTQWAQEPDWPAPVGRRVNAHLYDPADVDDWLARRIQGPIAVDWIPEGLYSLRDIAAATGLPLSTLRSRVQVDLLPPADDTSGRPHLWFGSTIAAAMTRCLYPRHCT
ncbi:helix-turn-helix transcriptional regulator [Streptomyces sp. NPDC002467]|uniref:helix-turn-helix transcriptional regulator n=1 Tax=Streptomyces sp. NPDC002467 TaxID=3364647 RepID=UPI00369FCE49